MKLIDSSFNSLLAVIIPIFNGERYIEEMLESIIHQTFQDWTLWIVDDNSTDGTFSILQNYAYKDNRIKPVKRSREPKGAQTCRNLGLELSEGSKYVIFFDADDIVAPYCFEQRVSYMESHPNLDFSIFPARTFREVVDNNCKMYYGVKIFDEDDLCTFFSGSVPYVVWNNIYLRSSLIRVGLQWDEKILSLQDTDFNVQGILRGMNYEYAVNTKVDYYYRVLQKNTVSEGAKSRQHQESHLYLLTKILCNLSPEMKRKYKYSLELFIIEFARRFALNSCNDLFIRMLKEPWVKKHFLFRVRLLAFYRLLRMIIKLGYNYNSRKPLLVVFPEKYHTIIHRERQFSNACEYCYNQCQE